MLKTIIWIEKNKFSILLWMASLAFACGFLIYLIIYKQYPHKALFYTLQLFVADMQTAAQLGVKGVKDPVAIYIVAILATATTFFAVTLLFLRDFFTEGYRKRLVKEGDHTLVIGLGSNNRYYIDSELQAGNTRIIVIEKDTNNVHISRYQDSGIIILNHYIDEVIDKIGIESVKNILISAGDDRENINIALKIIAYDEKNRDQTKFKNARMTIHIEDKNLRKLYHGETLLQSERFDIITFSFYEDAAINLFEEHSIDGDGFDIIQSHKEYHIAVVGDSQLSIEVIEQACRVAHLPNENMLHIHIVVKDEASFRKRLTYSSPFIEKIPTITLHYHSLDQNDISFYKDALFTQTQNLTHIILCSDNQTQNLSTAIKLTDITYRRQIVDDTLQTKIDIAQYTNSFLANKINSMNQNQDIKNQCDNKEINFVKQLNTFANARAILHRDNLIEDKRFKIAKVIRYGYGDRYKKEPQKIELAELCKKWLKNTSVNDKESNLAQAWHINLKLKAMGFQKRVASNDCSYTDLLKRNSQKIHTKLDQERKKLGIDNDALFSYSLELENFWNKEPYKIHYFPKEFETLFEKLIRAEHNRWNAYHYLLGFRYAKQKCKSKKEHDCLLPLHKFKSDQIKITVIYDIYSILYIPSYLANVRYEIVDL